MRFVHVGCGGEIDRSKRSCLKCGKKWNILAFLFTASEIRPIPGQPSTKVVKRERKPASYAGWADKVPVVSSIASRLPNWPRWARVLSVLVFWGVLITLVILAVRSCG